VPIPPYNWVRLVEISSFGWVGLGWVRSIKKRWSLGIGGRGGTLKKYLKTSKPITSQTPNSTTLREATLTPSFLFVRLSVHALDETPCTFFIGFDEFSKTDISYMFGFSRERERERVICWKMFLM